MKQATKVFLPVILAVMLLAGWTSPAYAALGVTNVTPGSVVNNAAATLTITGTDFDASAVVLLDGFGALATSFLNSQTLTAVVPAGVPAGDYTLRVTTSAPDSQAWPEKLHVTQPPPPPTEPPAFGRPQLVITAYKTSVASVQAGSEFKLKVDFENAGNFNANNAQAAFSSADLIPTRTGGVVAVGSIPAGGNAGASQTFLAVDSLAGKSVVVIDVTLSYYDDKGSAYSDKFTLSVPASGGYSGVTYPTSTPTGVNSAQLVITSYGTTVDPLQPGEQFELGMTVQNMGNTTAKRVTMIVGGGTTSGGGEGTPVPGGTSGGGGEFTNFAPVGASNIQSLGDVPAGGALQVRQSLIVNVSTEPGAYPIRISFSYVNDKGEAVNDEQVITLLVFSLPKLDISFYRDPGPMLVGQPNMLPIQIANLGKRTVVLGNMTVDTPNGILEVPSTLVGTLDQGGYFTFDASLIPDSPGPLTLTVIIDYTDDFNQPRRVQGTLKVDVEEALVEPGMDPSMNGGGGGGGGGEPAIMDGSSENFLQKAWRFILGLFGLDSSPSGGGSPDEGAPMQEGPAKPELPATGGKG